LWESNRSASPYMTFVTLSDTLVLRYPIPREFSAMTVVLPVQFSLSTFNFVTGFAATGTELAIRNVARVAFYIGCGAIYAVQFMPFWWFIQPICLIKPQNSSYPTQCAGFIACYGVYSPKPVG
jgi:hypothetical protein